MSIRSTVDLDLVALVLNVTPPFPPDIVEQDLVVRDLVDLVAPVDPPLESSVEPDSDLSENVLDRLSLGPSSTSARMKFSVKTADLVESIVLPLLLPSIFLPNHPNLPPLFPIPSALSITLLLVIPSDL